MAGSYDGDLLFSGVDLVLGDGDRVGVVGPNGAGKSTFLRILAGEVAPAAGSVTVAPGSRVGHVAQQVPDPDVPVGELLAGGPGDLARVVGQLPRWEARAGESPEGYAAAVEGWTALEGW